MKKIFIAILCFCVFSSEVRTASAIPEFGTHPIDIEYQKKIDDATTTVEPKSPICFS
jgi:hypothetical protein